MGSFGWNNAACLSMLLCMRLAKRNTSAPRRIVINVDPRDEIPNDELLAAMRNADRTIRSGKKLQGYSTVEEMMDALS